MVSRGSHNLRESRGGDVIFPGIPQGIPGRRDPLGLPEGEGYEPRSSRLTPFLGPGYPWGLVRCNGGF